MNPNQQPQNSTDPLPEAPPVETPVTQPEESIMQPAEPASTAPISEPVPPMPVSTPEPTPAPEPLLTAPIQPTAPVPPAPAAQFPQQPTTAFPQNTFTQPGPQVGVPMAPMPGAMPKKKNLGLLIGLISGGVIILGGLIAVLLIFVLPSGKISESDLVSETIEETTILRPKQWESVTVNNVSGFGDRKGKDDTSTAAIFVKKQDYVQSGIKDATSDQVETFRDTVISGMSSDDAASVAKEAGECTSTENVTITKSSVEKNNSIGILRVDATCVRDDGTFTLALYLALGDDGYLRSVFLMSTENLWKQNSAVFDTMLESADQV